MKLTVSGFLVGLSNGENIYRSGRKNPAGRLEKLKQLFNFVLIRVTKDAVLFCCPNSVNNSRYTQDPVIATNAMFPFVLFSVRNVSK